MTSFVHSLRLQDLKNPRVFGALAAVVPTCQSMPGEVIADVHSEVLSTIHYFKCVPIELFFSLSFKVFVLVDWDDLPLLLMALTLPQTSPYILIFLLVCSLMADESVNKTVIGKEAGQQLH